MDHTGWRRRLGVNKPVYCSQNKILLNMENGFQEIQLHIIKEKLIFKSFPPLFFYTTHLFGRWMYLRSNPILKSESEKDLKNVCCQSNFEKVKLKKT